MSAKATFPSLNNNNNFYQNDVINKRKAKINYCNNTSYCNRLITSNTYDNYYLYKNLINLGICNKLKQNKNNLVAGLYTNMNLNGICTVTNGAPCNSYNCNVCTTPVSIDPTLVFYQNYTIDPKGVLFGNTVCGIDNYINFTEF
jgi:hypothetical protein